MAKKIFYAVLLIAMSTSGAWADNSLLSTKMKPTIDTNKLTRLVTVQCPAGWTKTLDKSEVKSSWSENAPVVTCKPNPGLIRCPEGTYFYVKGNENQDGYKNGEIGCHTPVW
nr:hypothetical protein [uncultured Desulfobulbus sp.]